MSGLPVYPIREHVYPLAGAATVTLTTGNRVRKEVYDAVMQSLRKIKDDEVLRGLFQAATKGHMSVGQSAMKEVKRSGLLMSAPSIMVLEAALQLSGKTITVQECIQAPAAAAPIQPGRVQRIHPV